MPPSPFSALPPLHISDASPKAISGRTSYLRVRLEFLRYPQLIPCFFNSNVVRSSTKFYPRFNLAMDSSSGFGSTPCDWTLISNSLSLRLPYSVKLATECKSLTHYAKGTQSPLTRLLLFVCMRFQVLFHSPPGVLFAFPSRYWFTIGHQVVFSLGRWSSLLPTRFHVSRGTLDQSLINVTFTYRTITSYGLTFQLCSVSYDFSLMLCPQPQR